MAYFNQEMKAKLAPAIKAVLKKYGVKGTLSVRNHSTFVLNIKEGKIDFVGNHIAVVGQENGAWALRKNYIDVNPYHFEKHFSGVAKKFLQEVFNIMNNGNHDNSDIQSDYFDVGWYVDVNIGNWSKPYQLV